MAFTRRSAVTIFKALAAKVVARSGLTDLEEGGAVASVLYAFAKELALGEISISRIRNAYHFRGATGAFLDERVAELPHKGLTRLGAGAASGSVMRVERASDGAGGYPTEFIMEAGATFRRSDDPSQTYRTISPYTFAIGVGFIVDVWCVCTTPGKPGNCSIGTIDTVDSAEDEVIACTNYAPLTNGTTEWRRSFGGTRTLRLHHHNKRCSK